MSNIQSVIVYSNPLEAAFWESGMIFPLFCGMIVAVIAALSVNWLCERYNRSRMRRRPYGWGTTNLQAKLVVISAIVGMIGTIWFMM